MTYQQTLVSDQLYKWPLFRISEEDAYESVNCMKISDLLMALASGSTFAKTFCIISID